MSNEPDFPMAYEIASYLAWVYNPALRAHCERKASQPGWDADRYAEFLAKRWMLDAAQAYIGRHATRAEVRELASLATRREAGRIFVADVLSGEWADA